jgi:hypothetical protein
MARVTINSCRADMASGPNAPGRTLQGALGIPTGTVTYSLWTNNTCTTAATSPTFPGGGNTATVTITANGTIPNSPTLLFDTPGNFWWQAH